MGSPWTPGPASVVEAMKSVSFDAMGSNRSYWEFYFGFGVSLGVYMFAQAALLWLLAALAKTQAPSVRPFVVVLFVSYAANVFVAWRVFLRIAACSVGRHGHLLGSLHWSSGVTRRWHLTSAQSRTR